MASPFRILAAALLLAGPAALPAAAQAPDIDPRWQAFLGCWSPITQDGAQPVPDHVVCFRPAAGSAVTAVTVANDEVLEQELIRADGTEHAVREESCTGTESASWSQDGARLYLRSTLQCGDDVLGRETAGLLALAGGGTFVDVQAVGVDDQYGVRTLQYRSLAPAEYPASMRALAGYADDATRLYAAAPLALDDIVEAGQVLPKDLVQAMLLSLPSTRLQVDADALLALDAAGVDPEVIDVIVALAHPEKFAVATAPLGVEEDEYSLARREWMSYDPWLRYGRYGRYGYGSYYSPFGRYGYGGYGYGYGGGTVIIIDRDDLDDDGESSGRAAVVKGGGYTRIGPRPSSGGDSYEPRTTTSRPSVDRSTSSRGSSAEPSRGSSTTTRKAKPRSGCCGI